MQKSLIEHAAPTLAGLKTASMFNCSYSSEDTIREELQRLNEDFNEKGLYFEILRVRAKTVLIYVYRENKLNHDLNQEQTRLLLKRLGYDNPTDIQASLKELKMRLVHSNEFPHEIGLFLGYPFEDVLGFITHCGLNCKCCGYWKVYGDEGKAKRLFSQFTQCREIYKKLFLMGKTINQLIVAA